MSPRPPPCRPHQQRPRPPQGLGPLPPPSLAYRPGPRVPQGDPGRHKLEVAVVGRGAAGVGGIREAPVSPPRRPRCPSLLVPMAPCVRHTAPRAPHRAP